MLLTALTDYAIMALPIHFEQRSMSVMTVEAETTEPEIPEAAKREYEIVVNSRSYTVPSKTVTYDQVTKLAYPDWSEGDKFKVTYRRAGHGEWKLLAEGGAVEERDGEEFI